MKAAHTSQQTRMPALAVSAQTLSRLSIKPLPGQPAFGATVSGLTRVDLDDVELQNALRALWVDKGVLHFQSLDGAETHVALSRIFGPLEPHMFKESQSEGNPDLVLIKYWRGNGTVYEINGQLRGGYLPWHSDLVYSERINRGGVLRAIELPKQAGGQTGFIDQIAAYDALPDTLKRRIEGLHVVYVMDLNVEHMRFARPKQVRLIEGAPSYQRIMAREYTYPRVLHPMVFEQPETGRKVLNVSPYFALGIYEKGGKEGEALLAEVIAHCTDPRLTYFHEWRLGDMVLWDNWRTLHCATGVEADDRRVMERTTISGDYQLGRKLDGMASASFVV
jgi:taurine dioxygenase